MDSTGSNIYKKITKNLYDPFGVELPFIIISINTKSLRVNKRLFIKNYLLFFWLKTNTCTLLRIVINKTATKINNKTFLLY